MVQNKKSFVAYLDVLGYGKYVEKNNPDKVINTNNFFSLQAQIALAYTSVLKKNEGIDEESTKLPYKLRLKADGTQIATPNLDHARINSIIMSDSMLFWTASDSAEDLCDLLYAVAFFMQGQFIYGFPVRGAIAHGEFHFSGGPIPSGSTVQHFNLASRAQVLTQRLESRQLWTGCVLHESVIVRCAGLPISLDKLENENKIIKYSVPFHQDYEPSGYKEMYGLVWLGQIVQIIPEPKILDMHTVIYNAFLTHGKTVGPKEEVKIMNTAKFVNTTLQRFSSIKNAP